MAPAPEGWWLGPEHRYRGRIGDAQVYGDAWAFSPLQIQGTRHFVTTSTHTLIEIGCHEHTAEHWLAHFPAIGRSNGYSVDQIAEYGLILNLCAAWLKAKFPAKIGSVRDDKGRFAKKG